MGVARGQGERTEIVCLSLHTDLGLCYYLPAVWSWTGSEPLWAVSSSVKWRKLYLLIGWLRDEMNRLGPASVNDSFFLSIYD